MLGVGPDREPGVCEALARPDARQHILQRAALQAVFMNFMKSFSEKHRDASPAQRLGLTERLWTVRDFLARRRFVTRTQMPTVWQSYYDRQVKTRRLPHSRAHQLLYAN